MNENNKSFNPSDVFEFIQKPKLWMPQPLGGKKARINSTYGSFSHWIVFLTHKESNLGMLDINKNLSFKSTLQRWFNVEYIVYIFKINLYTLIDVP
jgi:hypothetical protein